LGDIPPLLYDPNEFNSYWTQFKPEDFELEGASLKLKIHEGNLIDCFDFFLNHKLIIWPNK
jgi:hypothetical protein